MMEFSEGEIREELAKLGYYNIPHHRLQEFKQDLSTLIEEEKSRSGIGDSHSSGLTSHVDDSYFSNTFQRNSHLSRYSPVYDKENRFKPYRDLGEANFNNSSFVPRSDSFYSRDYQRRPLDDQPRPFLRRAWEEKDSSPADESVISNTSSASGRRVIKRKVLRKQDGMSRVFDESVTTESDPDDLGVSRLSDRLHRVRVDNEDTDSESVTSQQSSNRPRQYFRSSASTSHEDANKKSVIIASRPQPHTKKVKKSDPVSRYQQTQQSWQLNKAPGEKKHKDLRWGIREQMLYHDEVVKRAPRVYVPNTYVVPTDKKRKSLVWQVRADMAKGNKPPVGGFT